MYRRTHEHLVPPNYFLDFTTDTVACISAKGRSNYVINVANTLTSNYFDVV